MDERQKLWLAERERLEALMKSPAAHSEAVHVFMRLHQAVHPGAATGAADPTMEDEALAGLAEGDFRRRAKGMPHSAAWLVWHMTRCEDITLSLLVAGTPQVLEEGWAENVCATTATPGNSMGEDSLDRFDQSVNIAMLRGYREAVTTRTREIVSALAPGDFIRKPPAELAERLVEAGWVAPEDEWLARYWGGRTVAGLLMMPATRHPLMHIDEIVKLRKKLSKTPGGL